MQWIKLLTATVEVHDLHFFSLSIFKPSKKSSLNKKKSFTVLCIESRWTLKHKPEVKLLTLMREVLNSWAYFSWVFGKVVQVLGAVSSIKADLIHLQRGDITDTLHIKSHLRTPTQWSWFWAVQTLPAPPPCILSGPKPIWIYTWQFGDEKKKN